MKLDKIDKKILYELVQDSRQTFKALAHKLRISKSTAIYRVKKLEDNNIITSYNTIINYEKTGKICGRILLKLFNINTQKYKEVVKEIKDLKNVSWLASIQGNGDIIISWHCNSISEFYEYIEEMQKKIGKNVKYQEVSVAHKIYHCAPNILFEKNIIPPVIVKYSGKKVELNDFENSLLKLIKNDPKISIVELSSKLNCSTKKIVSTKRRLEKEKVILRYSAVINLSELGYESYHIMWKFMDFDSVKINKFREYLLRQKETIFVTEALGRSNLESELLVKNQRKLYSLIDKIREDFPDLISDFDFFLMYDVIKSSL